MKIARDKQLHLIAGFLLAFTGLIVFSNPIIAGIIAGLFWGCFRESINKWGLFFQKRTGWDWYDVLYTTIGSTIFGLLAHFTGFGDVIVNSQYVSDIITSAPILSILYVGVAVLGVLIFKKKI